MDRRSFLSKSTTVLMGTLIVGGVSAKVLNERTPDTMQERIRQLREMKDIASVSGTVDYDPYFQGMANGLIVALAIMDDDEPRFVGAPREWGYKRRDRRLEENGQ